LMKHAHKF